MDNVLKQHCSRQTEIRCAVALRTVDNLARHVIITSGTYSLQGLRTAARDDHTVNSTADSSNHISLADL